MDLISNMLRTNLRNNGAKHSSKTAVSLRCKILRRIIKHETPPFDGRGFVFWKHTIFYGRLFGSFLVLMLSLGTVNAVTMVATINVPIMMSQIMGMGVV